MAKKDFDHTKAIDTEAPYPLSYVCVGGGGWGGGACQKLRKVGTPPPDENSWIRACSGFFFSN